MKRTTLHLSVAVSLGILLASCIAPGVKKRERPIANSPLLKALIDPKRLTPEAHAYLDEKGLTAQYRKGPHEVIVALHGHAGSQRSLEDRCVVAELCYDMGRRLEKKDPSGALGYYLAAVEESFPGLREAPVDPLHQRFVEVYNLTVGAVARGVIDAHLPDIKGTVTGPWKPYSWRWNSRGSDRVAPHYFQNIDRANYLKVRGMDGIPRHVVSGVGAAMVGHREATEELRKQDPFIADVGQSVPVTAIASISGDTVELSLIDMFKTASVELNGRELSLAADYTVPLASLFNYNTVKHEGFKRLLHPEEYMYTCRLDELSPFDETKIPLVFVHGLASDPSTWIHAINAVWGDPVLRKRYQVLVFSYPTGLPISYTSALFRDWLKQYHDTYGKGEYAARMRQMVLIGHSMGCLLSSAQIRTSAEELLSLYLTKPLDEIDGLNEKEKESIRHITVYDANTDVSRVVFMAGPHRGSDIARHPLGKLGTALIHLPRKAYRPTAERPVDGLTALGQERLSSVPDSIVELRPREPYLMAVLNEPMSKRVTYHSIIGRVHPNDALEDSSDRVVPYWSSHLDGAASEKVVQASHTRVTKNDDALAEMRRILYLHIGMSDGLILPNSH